VNGSTSLSVGIELNSEDIKNFEIKPTKEDYFLNFTFILGILPIIRTLNLNLFSLALYICLCLYYLIISLRIFSLKMKLLELVEEDNSLS
jgi:hypothetical protein